MTDVFLIVVNMSLAASLVIAAVLAARLALKKAPKKWSYYLWAVVGFRLCCPVTLQAVFSLFSLSPVKPETVKPRAVQALPAGSMDFLPRPAPVPQAPAVPAPAAVPEAAPSGEIWLRVAAIVWLAGIVALLIYSIFSYLRVKRRVEDAVIVRDNVYETDRISSPFLLGFIRPGIYVPAGLDALRLKYVLAHENYHLRRCDHLVKAFGFVLLAVHWFNPLVWLAFLLMGRDMEMSCDEHVLADPTARPEGYGSTLLSFAAPSTFPAASPLCFVESGVKSRIKNALAWRQPRTWVSILAGALCIFLIASCAVNPAEVHKDEEKPQAQSVSSETAVPQSDGLADLLRSLDDAGIHSIDNYNGASIFDRQKFAVMLKNAPDMAVNRTHLDSALWATKFHLANASRQMAAGGNYIYAAIGKSEGLVEISAVINKIPLNSFVADYPELYWKIRNLFAPSRGVDREAYEKYRSAADPYMLSAFSAMKENNPGFTDWEISEFYVFLERKDIGVTEYCASYAISGDVDSFPASGTINADMKLQGAAGMSYYIIVADGDVLRVISSAVKLSDFSSRQELLDYLSGRK